MRVKIANHVYLKQNNAYPWLWDLVKEVPAVRQNKDVMVEKFIAFDSPLSQVLERVGECELVDEEEILSVETFLVRYEQIQLEANKIAVETCKEIEKQLKLGNNKKKSKEDGI